MNKLLLFILMFAFNLAAIHFFSCRTKTEQSSHVCFGVVVFFFFFFHSRCFILSKFNPHTLGFYHMLHRKWKKKINTCYRMCTWKIWDIWSLFLEFNPSIQAKKKWNGKKRRIREQFVLAFTTTFSWMLFNKNYFFFHFHPQMNRRGQNGDSGKKWNINVPICSVRAHYELNVVLVFVTIAPVEKSLNFIDGILLIWLLDARVNV